jgi:hypothetical protein
VHCRLRHAKARRRRNIDTCGKCIWLAQAGQLSALIGTYYDI